MPRRECQNHEPSLRRVTFRSASPKPPGRNFVVENRTTIRHKTPSTTIRDVPPFSVQTRQKNTKAEGLPRSRSQSVDQKTTSDYKNFKSYYENGMLPIRISYRSKAETIWTGNPAEFTSEQLTKIIKMLVVGLPLTEPPYRMIAYNAFNYLLNMPVDPEILLDTMSDIVTALRKCLESTDDSKKHEGIDLTMKLTKIPPCAFALVGYYRRLLPPLRKMRYGGFNGFLPPSNGNLDYSIDLLLKTLEETGGPHAFINIKYVLPTYQSQTKS
ncbi:hypothetical protein QR680_000037 [Steinernema hermaphroditum]|uniref:Uncharacterized protein n=1 Tax=Steinernema hermaphroditum TaxID=289476 RepID=A0AA39LDA1_9BILA|nr:hypothetical protein QR680_000037 [Steinernema hermaphroditum]